MRARKAAPARRRATTKQATPAVKPVSIYHEIIAAISILEVVKRSMNPEAYELAALACVLRSLWRVHDRLDELGIGGRSDPDDDGED